MFTSTPGGAVGLGRCTSPSFRSALLRTLCCLTLAACGQTDLTAVREAPAPDLTRSTLALVAGDDQTGEVASTLASALVVEVRDQNGDPFVGAPVLWTFATGRGSAPGQAPAASVRSSTDGSGRASVSWELGTRAGPQVASAELDLPATAPWSSVMAQAPGGNGRKAGFGARARPAKPRDVSVTPGTATAVPAEVVQLAASAVDRFGNVVDSVAWAWHSTDAAVAEVDSTGRVTATGAGGPVAIVASAGSATGTAEIVVNDTVVTPPPPPPAPAMVGDLAVVSIDHADATLSWTAVEDGTGAPASYILRYAVSPLVWTDTLAVEQLVSAQPVGGAVSVPLTGLLPQTTYDFAVAARRSSDGVTGAPSSTASATTTVAPVVVASVTVSPSGVRLFEGESASFSAQAYDAAGDPLNGLAVTWGSSSPATLAVNGSGVATGLSAGTADVRATIGGVTGTRSVTVEAPPQNPPFSLTVHPDLPREYLDTSYPTLSGSTINVPAGGNLQAAIDAAQPGDEIVLAAGAVFTGNFRLRDKGGSDWIVIRSDASLPAAGTRMTPGAAGQLALIRSSNDQPALSTDPGASHYRVTGVAFSVAPSQSLSYSIIELDGRQRSVGPDLPHDIVLDRIHCYGHATLDVRRCVVLNATRSAVIDSYIEAIHSNNGDAQAVLGYNAPGPLKIVNNFLEASGENVMFGGADPATAALSPSDIELRGNHLYKPPAWFSGLQWSVKNLLELKTGHRILIEGNVFENNWPDSQTGWAIIMKTEDNSGSCSHCGTSHVTFRYNHIDNVTGGINLAALGMYGSGLPMNHILIHDNLMTRLGTASDWGSGGNRRAFQLLGGLEEVEISRNTIVLGSSDATLGFQDGQPKVRNFYFRANVTGLGQYGWLGTGTGPGLSTLNAYNAPYQFDQNVLVGGSASSYPGGNHFPGSFGAIGFVDMSGGDYRLGLGSPYRGISGNEDPGADMDRLDTALAGVR